MEDRPDLLVHLFFGVKDEKRVQNTGMKPGLYGRRVETYEYHDGGWTPVKSSRMTTYKDHEGVLVVDLAKVFRIGKLPFNANAGYYANVVRPDPGADWTLRLQIALLLPKSIF